MRRRNVRKRQAFRYLAYVQHLEKNQTLANGMTAAFILPSCVFWQVGRVSSKTHKR